MHNRPIMLLGGLGTAVAAAASLAMSGRAMLPRERMPEPEPVTRDPVEVRTEIMAAAQAKRLRKQAKRLGR